MKPTPMGSAAPCVYGKRSGRPEDQDGDSRRGVLSAEVRAGQYKYDDIEVAAHLRGMLDAPR
jgi:hypothetical protein